MCLLRLACNQKIRTKRDLEVVRIVMAEPTENGRETVPAEVNLINQESTFLNKTTLTRKQKLFVG